jgi:hypothetical protein
MPASFYCEPGPFGSALVLRGDAARQLAAQRVTEILTRDWPALAAA